MQEMSHTAVVILPQELRKNKLKFLSRPKGKKNHGREMSAKLTRAKSKRLAGCSSKVSETSAVCGRTLGPSSGTLASTQRLC